VFAAAARTGWAPVRAHFLATCYWAYAMVAQTSAFELGDEGLAERAYQHHQANKPLLVEAGNRYFAQLLG
jgi:hypothetical protein